MSYSGIKYKWEQYLPVKSYTGWNLIGVFCTSTQHSMDELGEVHVNKNSIHTTSS